MRRLAFGLVLVAACADPPRHEKPSRGGAGGARSVAAAGEAGAPQEAAGEAGEGGSGGTAGEPAGGSGAGRAGRGGHGSSGAGEGGDGSLAGQAGGVATGPRCDYIEACRAVAAMCTVVPSGQKCGLVEISTFGCGDEMGWYTADGLAFTCASTPDDCSAALTAVGMHCAELAGR